MEGIRMAARSLGVGLSCFLAAEAAAQKFTTLHTFTEAEGSPRAGLILAGKTLYGTAYSGGGFGNGTLFALNLDGSGFRTLHEFTAVLGQHYTNSDGANPATGLVLSGQTLYGTAWYGGSSGFGTVFSIDISGSNFVVLHSFRMVRTELTRMESCSCVAACCTAQLVTVALHRVPEWRSV